MSPDLHDLFNASAPSNVGGNGGGPLARFGPRKFRTKLLLFFGMLTLAYIGLNRILYGRPGTLVAVSAGAIVLGVAVVFFVSGMVSRPIVQLTRTSERLAKGDFHQRVRISGRDEFGLLARTFNAMVDGMERTFRDLESRNRVLEDAAAKWAAEQEKDAAERRRVETELRLARMELERRVEIRTEELARVNDELHGKVLETRRSEDHLQNSLERLSQALEATLKAMALTLETRDLYMAGHQHRVSELAVAIAQEMGLTWDKVECLRLAGIIHDIGKIATPVEILAKPVRLTKTEFQLVKDHPRVGYELIKDISFPWPVAHIVLQHHERLDGSGYPEGLAGDAILPEARVLAVADVIEALTAHRPYRPAVGLEKGMEEIRKGRGIRYDPRAVDACLKLFREHRFSFKKVPEAAAGERNLGNGQPYWG
jgi:putative nucleotidyltransferase with HDIG domain